MERVAHLLDVFPWIRTFDRILAATPVPFLPGRTVCLFSDYGGEHRSTDYATYSFLMVDLDASGGEWLRAREAVRTHFLRDGRRISFKGMKDARQRAALSPFLHAADLLYGLCLTIVVSKKITFDPFQAEWLLGRVRETGRLATEWAPNDLHKGMRVAHFAAYLLAAHTRKEQHVYWISDQDSTHANPTRTQDLLVILDVFARMHGLEQAVEMGVGTTAIDPGDRLEEDFASITDLSAGAVCEILSSLTKHTGGRFPRNLSVVQTEPFTEKTEAITSWLFRPTRRLAKEVILFEDGGGGRYSTQRFGR